MATIWGVDDEPSVRFTLGEILGERGHAVRTFARGPALLEALDAGGEVDLVLTDLAMPEMDGLAVLAAVRRHDPELPVVILTARGSERLAAKAIRGGAFEYLPKPFEIDELEQIVERALEVGALRRGRRRSDAESMLGRPLIGRAPAFRKVIDAALRVGRREVPVLVTGATGTGKELLAALLHAASARADRPLVRFNCAAISEELADSELFGHVKGAFTGASGAHRGYFARAHGGTLVLDEIGELGARLQPKLLRALQSGEIQPVGASAVERVDVRVVACTHRDLLEEARAGRFREDLYYRLAVVELRMPALAERPEDVAPLATAFAREAARRFGIEGVTLSDGLLRELEARAWPGNVRELENVVTRLVAMSEGGLIDASALEQPAASSAGGSFRAQVEALERRLLAEAMSASGNNQSEAARRLGLSRATFLDKLKRYALS